MIDPARSPKIKKWHLERASIVYARQSTPQQVAEHQESTARQYALVGRAVELGWPGDRVQRVMPGAGTVLRMTGLDGGGQQAGVMHPCSAIRLESDLQSAGPTRQ